MPTGPSDADAALRQLRELTRAARRDERRPGGSYELTEKELLGLAQICARLRRGPHLTEHEQAALGRMMYRLLNAEPQRGSRHPLSLDPVYGLIRKPLSIAA